NLRGRAQRRRNGAFPWRRGLAISLFPLLHERLRHVDLSAEAALHAARHSLEPLRLGTRVIVDAVDELVAADIDLVAVAQKMFGDGLAVNERAVRALQIFEKRVA